MSDSVDHHRLNVAVGVRAKPIDTVREGHLPEGGVVEPVVPVVGGRRAEIGGRRRHEPQLGDDARREAAVGHLHGLEVVHEHQPRQDLHHCLGGEGDLDGAVEFDVRVVHIRVPVPTEPALEATEGLGAERDGDTGNTVRGSGHGVTPLVSPS